MTKSQNTPLVIIVTDRYTTEALELLKQMLKCEVIKTETRPTPQELAKASGLLIRSRTEVTKEFLNQAPHLKVIVTATSGTDHIDFAAAKEKNITVLNTPDANTESAAELTLMLMLSTLRRFNEVSRALRDGRWKDGLTTGSELKGKVIGLIGLGRVGSRVAELLQCFGAEVIAHDPYQSDDVFQKLKIARQGFHEVLTQAEILSLHVPLTNETRRMIRTETLELAQDGLILINTSRGQVVDESALVTALESGEIAAAGLDVFEHEPLARDSRLRKWPNVVLTPHIGAYTDEAFARASSAATKALTEFFISNN